MPSRATTPLRMTVPELLTQIRRAAPFLSGITVSGGEATQQAGFVRAVHRRRDDRSLAHLTCFVDSNGACGPTHGPASRR